MASATEVRILSRRLVRPSSPRVQTRGGEERDGEQWRRCQLTPWDLRLINLKYIQKGILLPKPTGELHHDGDHLIEQLASSLSLALDHFFPLAGRLSTVYNATTPPSCSLFIDCNDKGAELIHAVQTSNVVSSDILAPYAVPLVVESFFPLNGATNFDGRSLPLLAVQATVLADGVFLGCALNHVAGDGFVLWNFLNSWAEISRTGAEHISRLPVTDRWFLDSCAPPIRLPFDDFGLAGTTGSTSRRAFSQFAFHFSAASVARLKAKANADMSTDRLSSLQSLLAHVWRCATRARGLEPHEETCYFVAVGNRSRLDPPLPPTYLGNAVRGSAIARAAAGELLESGLGWAAWLLNQAVSAESDAGIREWLRAWMDSPAVVKSLDGFKPCDLLTGSSPRFDVFGNDFGWGRPVAVRSSRASSFDGKVTVYPGPEKGSIGLEVCLAPHVLGRLLQDTEFMEVVCSAV